MRRLRGKDKPYVLLTIGIACFAFTAYFSFSEKSQIIDIDISSFINRERTGLGNQAVKGELKDAETPLKVTETQTNVAETQTKGDGSDKQVHIAANTRTTQEAGTVSPTSEVERRFSERKELLEDACVRYRKKLTYPRCEMEKAGFNYKYVNESSLVYCAIEKTGSTFWKRILHVIGGWSNHTNPTSIKSEDADTTNGGFETLTNSTLSEMTDIFNNSVSIMFVRDPYTRLFSAWLDKLYSPNHYYWTNIGPLIVKSERFNKEERNTIPVTCASDISFTEFISFSLKDIRSKSCVDGHFSPSHKHCLPCRISFDYIGKYETFKEDTIYLLQKLNLSGKVTFDDFEKDAAWDALRDSAEWVFSQKEKLLECNVTFHCALFKVWHRLQSRGILSTNIEFPFRNVVEVQNVTKTEVINVLTKAYHDSDPDETKHNREEALHQAFQYLPVKLRTRLVKEFEIDFSMYGYDSNPEYLNQTHQTSFNYFKECQD